MNSSTSLSLSLFLACARTRSLPPRKQQQGFLQRCISPSSQPDTQQQYGLVEPQNASSEGEWNLFRKVTISGTLACWPRTTDWQTDRHRRCYPLTHPCINLLESHSATPGTCCLTVDAQGSRRPRWWRTRWTPCGATSSFLKVWTPRTWRTAAWSWPSGTMRSWERTSSWAGPVSTLA